MIEKRNLSCISQFASVTNCNYTFAFYFVFNYFYNILVIICESNKLLSVSKLLDNKKNFQFIFKSLEKLVSFSLAT